MINYSVLKGVIPNNVMHELLDVTTEYRLNSPLRLAHFLAQCAHESAKFSVVEEKLSYTADRLLVVFKKYFPNREFANQYANNPKKLASYVYANRLGNGGEETEDGWRFRGRGYIQLTGRDNYANFDKTVSDNIILNPDLVAIKYPLTSAAWFWRLKKLNEIADLGASDNEVSLITKKVNGGYIGLAERIKLFNQFYKLINE